MTIDPFAPFVWRLAHGRSLTLGPRAQIMAIVNVTPDSFSDGGAHLDPAAAVAHAKACHAAGAAILDIGGESTRPGAAPVTAEDEQARILPVIARLAAETDAILSVDTYRAETAARALAAGAHLVNDVHGLWREPALAEVAARNGAGLCIMHTGRERQRQADVIEDQRTFFDHSLGIARAAGLADDTLVLDPGFGFAKETAAINLELMARLGELFPLGFPLLVGTSRKRFLGTLTGREAAERDAATVATSTILRLAGAAIFRVHAVAPNVDALKVADALLAARGILQPA
ncbi:dihydropteroate synthase [Xaviernesmea oryzae]|uniref:Dihydropteroate synthase n=1 Tax=Xaviernesmea oryzae TaxID=464029 RepID=A0A1Q9B0B5_9HYPH|nr:dihydropteroate synthase [Xaviernesmea oryzae]OLP61394.1 dihydropteroate synthase [Xaviernesmea oryzae]SEL70914.1 dihydropteroate synthase [Xaviernesmea oryzae]